MTIFEIDPEAAPYIRPSRKFPILLQISVERSLWSEFQRRFEECPDVLVLTGVPADDDWMTVYVATSDREAAERLDDGWNG